MLNKDVLLFVQDAKTNDAYSFSTVKSRYDSSNNDLGVPIIKLFREDTNTDG